MPNDYFNHSANIVPSGTRARADHVNNIANEIAVGLEKLPSEPELKQGTLNYAADTGVADAYVIELTYLPTLSDGLAIRLKAANANTGASTLNVNGLGAKSLKHADGTELSANDIAAGQVVTASYNGVEFRITSSTPSLTALAQTAAITATTKASESSVSEIAAAGSAVIANAAANSLTGLKITGKNLIINGKFYIDQRNEGVSKVVNAVPQYTLDRWSVHYSNSGDVIRDYTDSAGSSAYSLKATAAGTNTYLQIGQPIEFLSFAHLRNKQATFSVWMKATNGSGLQTCNMRMRHNAGVDVQTLFSGTPIDTQVILTDTWAKYVHTFTVPNNALSMSIEIQVGGSVNSETLHLSNAQLEEGSTATDLEYRPIGEELALCQRYYEKFIHKSDFTGPGSATYLIRNYAYRVVKRVAGSVTVTNALYYSSGTPTPYTAVVYVSGLEEVAIGSSTLTNGGGLVSATISVDAEIY